MSTTTTKTTTTTTTTTTASKPGTKVIDNDDPTSTKSSSSLIVSLPIIQLDNPDLDSVSKELHDACIQYGFFYISGHTLSKSFLDKVFYYSKLLFDCPLDEKEKLINKQTNRGYTCMEEETLDPIVQQQSGRGDTKEGYYIGIHYDTTSSYYNPSKLMVSNIWPTSTTCTNTDIQNFENDFKDIMKEYFQQVSIIALQIIQIIAKSLHLSTSYFNKYFTQPMAILRLLHYTKTKSIPDNGLFACGAHSDYGMITLLLTDNTPGLQILTKDTNEWISIPSIPPSSTTTGSSNNNDNNYYFIVNIGDMLERWTNGLYKSTRHRVVTDGTTDRYSIPFFYEPNFDTIVECIPSCCNTENNNNPPKYPPIKSGQYLINKYTQTHSDFEGSDGSGSGNVCE